MATNPQYAKTVDDFTHLQRLQLLDALLDQLLYSPLLRYALILSEGISRSPFCVLAEIVGGELITLSE